ncbi:MAG TPA: hypothetical protein VK582_17580 [Pyrinomonadaceae bacterium]|nr:hypothetical protein [Pyrinomonadaceae bacterium]
MSHITRFFFLLLAFAGAIQPSNAQIKSEWKSFSGDRSFSSEVLPASPGALLSFREPDGMILSEGNLYFTSHDAAGATVWRTSQTSIPGQETVLYWEPGAIFSDIVFAEVDGIFWGYFFAAKLGTNFSGVMIKRIPLTGGTASVLANVERNVHMGNHHNLVTDGENLYWQDVQAIRKMPIRGGTITSLDLGMPNTDTAGIELQNGSLIVYASNESIRFVPTSGTNTTPESRTIVVAEDRVTALHAVSNGTYWGDVGPHKGNLNLRVAGVNTTLVAPRGYVTSISTKGPAAGGAQAWTECAFVINRCFLNFARPGFKTFIVIGDGALGVTVTSSRSVFWGDISGVHRITF